MLLLSCVVLRYPAGATGKRFDEQSTKKSMNG
jgi:hypothetical protein